MRRPLFLGIALAVALAGASAAAPAPGAKAICVGGKPGCYATVQAAVDAAHDGDTISIAKGTFAGGVTIDKSISLVGAGAGKTIISGGGPVLTLGVYKAPTEPTVSIDGVTVTGGVTTTSAESRDFVEEDGVFALGGGIDIPPNSDFSGGASVSISNSVITHNKVTPTVTLGCDQPCSPFALAAGGGIYNSGQLTLRNTTVGNNTAGGPTASKAVGAGILSTPDGSSLTVQNSVVSDNQATVSDPNGVQATGAGILAETGNFVVRNSAVSGNRSSLTSTKAAVTGEFFANAAGIGCDRSATITNTRIDNNVITVSDPNGEPAAFDSGLSCGNSGGTLTLKNSSVSGNRILANVADTTDSGPNGTALEFDGPATITNTRITGNTTTVTTVNGLAGAVGAVSAFDGDPTSPALISNSVISNNTMTATSTNDSATVQGGGIVNAGALELRNDQISHNNGTAHGADGFAQGGGIWNGELFGASPTSLTLDHTAVDHNTLDADSGISTQGGGLYTLGFLVTLTHSTVHHNNPDDCDGC